MWPETARLARSICQQMFWRSLTVAMESRRGVNVHFWWQFEEVRLGCGVCSLKICGQRVQIIPSQHLQRVYTQVCAILQHSVLTLALSQSHTFIICHVGIESV